MQEQSNSWFNKALLIFVPFMVGWFALNLPAGLGLYYFSNTMITSGIQIWLRKLGGTLLCSHFMRASFLGLGCSSKLQNMHSPTCRAWGRESCLKRHVPCLDLKRHCARASALDWQQEIVMPRAGRTGEVANMDALLVAS